MGFKIPNFKISKWGVQNTKRLVQNTKKGRSGTTIKWLRCGLFPGKKSGQILGKDIEENIVGKYWHKHHVGVARPDPG